MIKKLVRNNILALTPYTSARGQHLKGVLLDANENSFGTSASNYIKYNINRYPDPGQFELRAAVGKIHNMPIENIFFGVGSDEIIDIIIRIFCNPGTDKALIFEPTYGMYKVACDINDIKTIRVVLNDNFQIDLNSVEKSFEQNVKLIFLCSPNNPTANLLERDKILELCKTYNSIIVVDEAYVDFKEEASLKRFALDFHNLIILRTFSKAWGMAGARLGYCFASDEIIEIMFKVKAPYNINELTKCAALEAINNIDKKNEFIILIEQEKQFIVNELQKAKGIEIFPSDANFILFRIKNAKEIYNTLVNKGVIIRDRSSDYNLNNCLRLTIGTREENLLFIETFFSALTEINKKIG